MSSQERNIRRAQEREKRKAANKRARLNPDYDPSRRRFLVAVGGLLALGGGAAVGGITLFSGERRSDQDIILQEATRLGFVKDSDEIKLWEGSYQDTNEILPTDSSTDKEFSVRIFQTLELMGKSKNPYFREASKYLYQMRQSGRMEFYRLADWQGDASAGVGFGPNDQGVFQYELNVNPDFVLNGSTALTLAGVLTHESWHIRRYDAELAKTTGLSPDEKMAYLNDFQNLPGQLGTEEAFAYAKEAEAYINEAGLMGQVYAAQASGEENRAARYIQLGSNFQNPEWMNYIANNGGVKQ